MKRYIVLLAAGILVAAPPAHAQYYGSQVLAKSFERTEFFFQPTYLNPFGLGSKNGHVPGMLDDPLVDLRLSPSRAGADSSRATFAYVDFRGTKERNRYDNVYPSYRESDLSLSIYPRYYGGTREVAEPVIAAAAFFQPLDHLTIGLTYQAISNDQDYYGVPQDTYRGAITDDFAESVAADIPITDVYAGDNAMHQSGHFPEIYASYALTPRIRGGVRIAYSTFTRDGETGSRSDYSGAGTADRSLWGHFEGRDQDYRALDLSVGIEGQFSPTSVAGLSIGRLDGSADQTLVRTDTSSYSWDSSGSGSRWISGGASDATWEKDGGTIYLSAFLRRTLDASRVVTATYRAERLLVDSRVDGTSRDSSYGFNSNTYNSEYWFNESRGSMTDQRIGGGDQRGWTHRASAGLRWRLTDGAVLNAGASFVFLDESTNSNETVTSGRYSYYDNLYRDPASGEQRTTREEDMFEDKELFWTMSRRQTSLQIPVVLEQRLSDHFQLVAGVTRDMIEWQIKDETLAIFDERSRTVDGVTDKQTNFGERYRQPTERRTEVSTSVLLGIIASPSEQFDVRLLVTPRWSDLHGRRTTEWWLGFLLYP